MPLAPSIPETGAKGWLYRPAGRSRQGTKYLEKNGVQLAQSLAIEPALYGCSEQVRGQLDGRTYDCSILPLSDGTANFEIRARQSLAGAKCAQACAPTSSVLRVKR